MHLITDLDFVFVPAEGRYNSTWHGLEIQKEGGISLDGSNIPEVFRLMVEAGFKPDFNAEISTVPAEMAEFLGVNPMTDWKVILADLRENNKGIIPVHVCKKGYSIHQNKLIFDSMVKAAQQVLGTAFEIVTVGTLGAYSQFFVSIAIKGENESFTIGADDLYHCFYNAISSHNGLVSSQTLLSAIRAVCMNTVQASIADASANGTSAGIRHTAHSTELITADRFAQSLESWVKQKDQYKATLLALRGVPMSADEFKSFAAGVFSREDSDVLSTRSFNRIEELLPLFQRGKGNKGETAYDAINAFTEYFTDGNGVGSKKVKNNRRIASANFGRGNEWKLEAMRAAGDPETLADVLERGTILYADKLKADAAKD